MLVLLSFLACDRLEKAGETVDSFGDTTVAQGLLLGADFPDGLTLPPESKMYSAACKVFLAEVTDTEDVSDAPVSGAEVAYVDPGEGSLEFQEEDAGEYLLYSMDGLSYDPGGEAVVRFEVAGESGELRVEMPEAPEVEVPSSMTAGDNVRVRVTQGRFANLVLAVYDVDHEKLTWDNLPDDVGSTYELNASDEVVDELVIPGEAFKREALYVVGVGGLVTADPDTLDGVNRSLSTFAAAQMSLHIVEASKE
ncbi:MAG: hypothetical protein FJ090_12205 [Deltaproteobacteria bacterium]|nr:hypothetical protein [Deltaproteobacteria bacterium]